MDKLENYIKKCHALFHIRLNGKKQYGTHINKSVQFKSIEISHFLGLSEVNEFSLYWVEQVRIISRVWGVIDGIRVDPEQ